MQKRRTKEELIAALNEKKDSHLKHIASIDAKIEAIKNRKPAKTKSAKTVILEAVKESKRTPEEILAFLKSAE